MKNIQVIADKFSIGLSMLCTIHCLLLPVLLVALPSLSTLHLQDEAFHQWMIIIVIPTSIYALTTGCKKHQRYLLLLWGISGLTLMASALLIGHDIAGETGEKTLTFLGSILVAIAHLGNFKRCRQHKECTD